MKITNKLPISTLLLCGLAACGGSGDDPMQDPPECTVNCDPSDEITLSANAISPSISEGNIVSRLDIFDEVESERRTGVLPIVGNADYKGYMFTELEGETPLANELHGTIYVNVNFVGDEISGDIRNLHTAMDGDPVEKLTGSLDVDGEADGLQGTFDADFSSNDVAGQINFEEVQDLEISGSLDGLFRDVPNGNVLINPYDDGAAATGDVDLTIEGDTRVDASGTFYVRDRQYE